MSSADAVDKVCATLYELPLEELHALENCNFSWLLPLGRQTLLPTVDRVRQSIMGVSDEQQRFGCRRDWVRGPDRVGDEDGARSTAFICSSWLFVLAMAHVPLAHFRRPCGLSVSALLLAFLWVAAVLAVLILRFLPASAKGSKSREWRDGALAATGLGMLFLLFASAFYVVYYCLCLRRRAEYVEPNETSA
ncbi:hypothetical protein HPB52_008863 [Rhipicephalus sanguineus]|uniref:Uncharacterized protein n=1 Tax=Rhipicephalus sanguineus TaxID=34632 RepID=A0A9D4PVG2_RHISA|nr:hypothetical protein HPB52_008863 [Rhipicephalus sanguineus]